MNETINYIEEKGLGDLSVVFTKAKELKHQILERLSLASYFAEVMEAVAVEGRPDPPALSLILNSLYALDRLNRPLELVKAAFELKLMCLEGYEPLLDACAVCGAPEPESPLFHLNEGVLCCAACRAEAGEGAAIPLEGGALAAMRHIVYGDRSAGRGYPRFPGIRLPRRISGRSRRCGGLLQSLGPSRSAELRPGTQDAPCAGHHRL